MNEKQLMILVTVIFFSVLAFSIYALINQNLVYITLSSVMFLFLGIASSVIGLNCKFRELDEAVKRYRGVK